MYHVDAFNPQSNCSQLRFHDGTKSEIWRPAKVSLVLVGSGILNFVANLVDTSPHNMVMGKIKSQDGFRLALPMKLHNGQLPLATKIIVLQKSDTKSQAVSATELKMAEYEVAWEHGSPPISCLLACKRLLATTLECEGLLGNIKFQFLKRPFFQLIINKSNPHVFGLKIHVETVKWNIHRANSWAHEGLLKHFLSRSLSPDFDVQKTPGYYGGNPAKMP